MWPPGKVWKNAWVKDIADLGACREAVLWADQLDTDLQSSWRVCPNGLWMLWLLIKYDDPRLPNILREDGWKDDAEAEIALSGRAFLLTPNVHSPEFKADLDSRVLELADRIRLFAPTIHVKEGRR